MNPCTDEPAAGSQKMNSTDLLSPTQTEWFSV